MIIKRYKMPIPEYRGKKEIFEALGYKEVFYKERRTTAYATLEYDNSDNSYYKIKKIEKLLIHKGLPFFPIFIFIIAAFALLTTFVILLAKSIRYNYEFEYLSYILSLILPAFVCLAGSVVYSYFYFNVNHKIESQKTITKEELIKMANAIKNK